MLVFSALLGLFRAPCVASEGARIAVFPFVNRDETLEQPWHAMALAELFSHLFRVSTGFEVVERQRIEDVLEEVGLAEAGIVDTDTAVRAGRIAAADYALFGSFLDHGETMHLEAHIVGLSSNLLLGAVVTNISKDALIEWIPDAASLLTGQLNTHPHLSPDISLLAEMPTRSYTAMERLYRGLRLFDSGRGLEALRLLVDATQEDMHFGPALYWLGRLYERRGDYDLAVIQYGRLADAAGIRELAWSDLSQAAAMLLSYGDYDGYGKLLAAICTRHPADPRSLLEYASCFGDLPPGIQSVNYLEDVDDAYVIGGNAVTNGAGKAAVVVHGRLGTGGSPYFFVAPDGYLFAGAMRTGATNEPWSIGGLIPARYLKAPSTWSIPQHKRVSVGLNEERILLPRPWKAIALSTPEKTHGIYSFLTIKESSVARLQLRSYPPEASIELWEDGKQPGEGRYRGMRTPGTLF
jgi:tetratricopeptide (TPR) repeat protein